VIHLANISKSIGPRVLFAPSSFQINPGDKVGLVGPNGAGKTTIFRVIMGEERLDTGSVNKSEKLVVGYFSQDVGEMKGTTALEEVKKGAQKIYELGAKMVEFEKMLADPSLSEEKMTQVLEKYGELQHDFEERGGYDLDNRAKEIITGLGIKPEDHDRPIESFSGGWKMRVALAKILLLNPDVLLMDEPTNHLDLESIIWLEEWLVNFKGSVVMTSHDREFMNRIVKIIVEVAHQKITVYGGNYDFYEKEKEVRKEQTIAAHKRQQDMLAKEEDFIARFAARASHAAQVQSRVKKLEKIERVEIPPEERTMDFTFPVPPRSGNEVVKMEALGKSWTHDDGRVQSVFGGVTGLVKRLDKIAVVGVNGAGKSTFLKVIAGETEATQGKVTIGAAVKIGYFSQHSLDVLKPNRTVFEEVEARLSNPNLGFIRNLLGAFLFSGDDVHKKISVLSGGEKSRVILATLMANPLNFLILDEPTNHLDIKSREILLKNIRDFDGTVILVSHDRHFLRAIAHRVFEVGHGHLTVYEGNYDYYLHKTQPVTPN
jgi:ATP-binding cassette, subfamily F, member 3